MVNPAAGREMKRLVGTLKTGGNGRVGKMLEMLEKGGWDQVEREVREREDREEKIRRDMGLSPRVLTSSGSVDTVPERSSSSPSPHVTTKPSHVAKANGAPILSSSSKALQATHQGLEPERRILAYGLGAVQGKRCVLLAGGRLGFLSLSFFSLAPLQTDNGRCARCLSRTAHESACRLLWGIRWPRRYLCRLP